MRKTRGRPPKLRVVRQKPRRKNNSGNVVYDEDVLRWQHQVSDADAMYVAVQAGFQAPCLPPNQNPPTVLPEAGSNAVAYIHALPEDARRVLYRHCEMVARHQRLLMEGQERLRYVQAQIKEMKARLPPPPPPEPEPPVPIRGPVVRNVPVANPTCWASCCGLFPLPEPPEPPPPPRPGAPMLAIPIPKTPYFRELVQEKVATARRRTTEQAARERASNGGADDGTPPEAESAVQPVTSSVGGASDAPPTRPHAGLPPGAAQSSPPPAADAVGTAAELPGQLDAPPPPPPATAAVPKGEADDAREPSLREALPASTVAAALPLPPRSTLAPMQGKAPGFPQSLLRPLAPLPSLQGKAGAEPGPEAGSPAGEGGQTPGGTGTTEAGAHPAAAALEAPPGRRAPLPPLRSLEPKPGQAAEETTADPGKTETRLPRDQQKQQEEDAPAAAAVATGAGPPFDLSRYQNPESLRKITTIQAAQRGRLARKEAARVRSQQRRGADGNAAQLELEMGPEPGTQLGQSLGGTEGHGRDGAQSARSALPPLHPFADPEFGAPAALAEQAAAAARVADTDADSQDVLSRYRDPESLQKITTIQAVQRGRMARRETERLRAARGAASSGPPPPATAVAGAVQEEADAEGVLQPRTAVDATGEPAGPSESSRHPFPGHAFGAAEASATPPEDPTGGRALPIDLSRYQDPESLQKITTIQAVQRGRMARREAAGRRAARGAPDAGAAVGGGGGWGGEAGAARAHPASRGGAAQASAELEGVEGAGISEPHPRGELLEEASF